MIGATDVFLDSVANSAVFPRNWASFTPVPRRGEFQLRVAVFGASFYAQAAIFNNSVFLQRVTIKSRHILRLIINTVNYQANSKPPNVFDYRLTHCPLQPGSPSCPQIRVILARQGEITSIPVLLFVALV